MSGEPGDTEGPGIEFAVEDASVLLHDGSCWVEDPEYLDRSLEAQGVLAMQFSLDRGLWILFGEGEGPDYRQEWRAVADLPPQGKRGSLKTVN